MPQAFGVAVYWNDGSDVSGWIAASGEWESVDGMITRTNLQAGGTTHTLVLEDVIDMTSVTFPAVLNYDVMVEADAEDEGEVWSGIGISWSC